MICPKCGAVQGEETLECGGCGVIFAKLTPEDFGADQGETKIKVRETTPGVSRSQAIKTCLLGRDQEENPIIWAGRIFVYLIILIWGGKFIATPMASDYFAQTFLHGINLAFHEAGHIIFGFFGNYLGVFGGTLGQIVIPLICMGAFIYHVNPFAAAAALWWTGQSFMDIAPYINDARALQLPLLGGNIGSDNPDFHDWHHLLRDLGWLNYDHTLAVCANRIGVLLMITSFIWGGYVLYRQYKTIQWGKS